MTILGIESSCDETAAAIISAESGAPAVTLLSQTIATSLTIHGTTGGIIPEIAAREQLKYILPVIKESLEKAKMPFSFQTPPPIDAIAVTYGPGLIGSLLVGVETAKTLSYLWNKPIIPMNHMLGHIYANWITPPTDPEKAPIQFPALALITSGAHTDLILLKAHGDYEVIGGTRDDAAGECFDKCARLIGYEYPGGPKIAKLAEYGNPKKYQFPRPMLTNPNFDFSFSGLKTAFLTATKEHFPVFRTSDTSIGWQQAVLVDKLSQVEKQIIFDLCASLQEAIVDVLVKKTMKAAIQYNVKTVMLSGGVAANQNLRDSFENACINAAMTFSVPPKIFCTDNAAMIATAAFYTPKTVPWQDITVNPELYY